MIRKHLTGHRRWLLGGAVALAAIALGGTALAAQFVGDVKTFTGCLSAGDGVIVKVKQGDAPKSACSSGQTLVRISGGDITKISVTGGLTGGGDNGDVTIGLDPAFSLPQSCAAGKIAKWDGSAWVCGTDSDTTYTAGTGLDLSAGQQFSVEPTYRVKNTPDCSEGQFATGYDSSGEIVCGTPPAPTSTGVEVWQKTAGTGNAIDLPDGEGVDLVTMTLPAGTVLITAVAIVRDESGVGDDQVAAHCRLRDGAFATLPVTDGFVDIGEGQTLPGATVVVHGLVSLASTTTVRFTCFGSGGHNKAEQVTVTALKVGTVHAP
jgi:hypothetical protein